MLIIPLNLDFVRLFLHNSKLAYYPSVQDSFTRENRYGQIGKIKKQKQKDRAEGRFTMNRFTITTNKVN